MSCAKEEGKGKGSKKRDLGKAKRGFIPAPEFALSGNNLPGWASSLRTSL